MKNSKLLALKRRLIKPFVIARFVFNRTICLFFGHKPVVNMLIETEYSINSRGCPRCKLPLRMPEFWKNMPPPPNSTPKQLESWHKYYESKRAEVVARANGL